MYRISTIPPKMDIEENESRIDKLGYHCFDGSVHACNIQKIEIDAYKNIISQCLPEIHRMEKDLRLNLIASLKAEEPEKFQLSLLRIHSSDENAGCDCKDHLALAVSEFRSIQESVVEPDYSIIDEKECTICMGKIEYPKQLPCNHVFCKECIKNHTRITGPQCPECFVLYGKVQGEQPPGGLFKLTTMKTPSLSGFPDCGIVEIEYVIPSGKQGNKHPNPGKKYRGTKRTAYLPNNSEGRNIAKLFERAFNERHIFTVGRSATTGEDNCIIWGDIHHKTVQYGTKYGYPDPEYLKRVREELRAKGIVSRKGDNRYLLNYTSSDSSSKPRT